MVQRLRPPQTTHCATDTNKFALPANQAMAKPTKKQSSAFLLLFCLGILPFILVARFSGSDVGQPFYDIFSAKVISCSHAFEAPQNSTITGIEGLFVLDLTFGSFPFSQAKLVDVAWDLFIGRGCQLIAWL